MQYILYIRVDRFYIYVILQGHNYTYNFWIFVNRSYGRYFRKVVIEAVDGISESSSIEAVDRIFGKFVN